LRSPLLAQEHPVADPKVTDPPESPTDLVLVKNSEISPDAPPARMTREAWELSFKDKGFVLVDDDGKPLAKTKASGGASA
jgi:hypothetical protein